MIRHPYEPSVITPGRCGASERVPYTYGHFRCCGKPESAETHNPAYLTPKLRHTELRSLSEVQSERDNAPQCRCNTNDDSECQLRDVEKCLRLEREREYGVVDERDYAAGRGMPR
jgi:hypothetical protein